MKVVYDGPQPTRTVEVGPGKNVTFTKGKAEDVPAPIGERLVEQRHFRKSTKTKSDAGGAGGQKGE